MKVKAPALPPFSDSPTFTEMHGEGETADMGYNIVMSGTDKYAGHP